MPNAAIESQAKKAEQKTAIKDDGGGKSQSPIFWIVILLLMLAGLTAAKMVVDAPDADDKQLEVTGRIEADETRLVAPTSTKVTQVLVKEGDRVHKGQLLMRLDNSLVQSKLRLSQQAINNAQQAQQLAQSQVSATNGEIAEARKKSKGFWAKLFTSKKKKEETKRKLGEQMGAAQSNLIKSRTGVLKAQAMKEEVASKLSYFQLTSPIDGVVSLVNTNTGELVKTGQVLVTIIDPVDVYMRGFISENDMNQMHAGQVGKAYIAGDDKTSYPANVQTFDDQPSFTPENVYMKDEQTRLVFGVKIGVRSTDGKAKPGMSCRVVFTGASK